MIPSHVPELIHLNLHDPEDFHPAGDMLQSRINGQWPAQMADAAGNESVISNLTREQPAWTAQHK